jgi:hypothetical protein
MSVMNKFFGIRTREDGYGGIVESLVGSVITFIAMAGTALAINGSLQTSLSAQNYTKAATYIQEVFAIARNTEYNQLGISIEGGDNTETIDINNKDIVGCNPYLQTFENEFHNEQLGGLNYCQIKEPSGKGINFNVETHVTNVGTEQLNSDFRGQFGFNSGTVYAKRVTVIVTWFEGDRTVNDLPILRSAESEILITPSMGFCPPSITGLVGGCNN